MGAKLIQYYEKAASLGGLKAKMRLAVLTNIPSTKAEAEADSDENVKKFDNAMAELQKEFS